MNHGSYADWRARSRFASDRFPRQDIEQAIHQRFEKQVVECRNRIVVKTGSGELTYDDLNRLANRIAMIICTKCTGDADRVALFFSHGVGAFAAMLGVLKSGKVYVPVDVSYPAARIHSILDDAQAAMIISDNRHIEKSRSFAGGRIHLLNVDEISDSISAENPGNRVRPESFAYILYTSGSTGQPKGVLHTHQNLLHQVWSYSNTIGLTISDRLSLLSSYSVGAAHLDIYGALLNGAVLYPFDVKDQGLDHLVESLINEQITVYHSVPTLFRHIMNHLTGEKTFPNMRVVNLGGEPVSARDFELFKKHFTRRCIFVNSLACTEAGVYAQYFMDHDSELKEGRIPSGYPTEDMEIVLLDDRGGIISRDQHGEIMIKSRYLSPGYWQNPSIAKATFVLPTDGKKILAYHTGDVGRMQRDGLIEYMGRKDFQVKIRGYRIEITEIEQVLQRHPMIRDAAVIWHGDPDGEKQVTAYVVLHQNEEMHSSRLLAYMRDSLPEHMLPARICFLESLPLTPNGKLDRNALKVLHPDMMGQKESGAEPQTPVEQRLAEMWCQLMKMDQVGIDDNFFDTGGDSLMAIDLFCWIEKEYGKRMSPTMIYQWPTIKQLASIIGDHLQSETVSCLIPMRLKSSTPPLFAISDILGSPLLYSGLMKYLNQDQTVYGIKMSIDDLRRTIEETALYYVGEIRKLFPHGPYFLIGFSSGGIMALEIARIFHRMQIDVPYVAMIDTIFPSVSEKRPPLRKGIFSFPFLKNLPFWFFFFAPHWVAYYARMARNRNYRNYYREAQDRILTVREWLRNYQPEAYSGRVIFYRAKAQGLLTTSADKGWNNICTALDIQVVPGSHVNMMQKPHVKVLAEKMNAEFRKCHSVGHKFLKETQTAVSR